MLTPLSKRDDTSGHMYSCLSCNSRIAWSNSIMSKAFTGRHGRAFLFRTVENVALGDMEDRILATGMHTISDLHCTVCRSVVGWKYLFAFEDTQKYKEGLFVIEKNRIVKHTGWSD